MVHADHEVKRTPDVHTREVRISMDEVMMRLCDMCWCVCVCVLVCVCVCVCVRYCGGG